jgi:peroxidase
LVGGLINTPAQTYDPFITREVTNHLFQEPTMPHGLDLPAMNLMRSREQGVPGYNFFREWCGLGRARTFDDLIPFLQNDTVFHYSRLYKYAL